MAFPGGNRDAFGPPQTLMDGTAVLLQDSGAGRLRQRVSEMSKRFVRFSPRAKPCVLLLAFD